MTRQEWVIHYRGLRSSRPKVYLDQSTLLGALRELYDHYYTEVQEAFNRLSRRYNLTLTKAQSDRVNNDKVEAKARALRIIQGLVYHANPFMSMLNKEDFSGQYTSVILEYK